MNPDLSDIEFRGEHLKPLRRFLAGDVADLERLAGQPGDPDVEAARTLILTATAVAIRRRFGNSFYQREIIRFVADLRISLGEDAKGLDPRVLEEVIRVSLGAVHPKDIHHSTRDPEMTVESHLLILEKLRDENVVPLDEIDEFAQETVAFAQQMLATQRALAAGTLSL